MDQQRRISVALPDRLADRLDAKIEKSGLTVSDVVRHALDNYLNAKGDDKHGK